MDESHLPGLPMPIRRVTHLTRKSEAFGGLLLLWLLQVALPSCTPDRERVVELMQETTWETPPTDEFPASLLRNQRCAPLFEETTSRWFVCRRIDRQGTIPSFIWISGSSSGVVPGTEMVRTPYIYPVEPPFFYSYKAFGCADRSWVSYLLLLDTTGIEPLAEYSVSIVGCDGNATGSFRFLSDDAQKANGNRTSFRILSDSQKEEGIRKHWENLVKKLRHPLEND